MSKLISADESNFEIGDLVSFDHGGHRLHGVVIRIYTTRRSIYDARDLFHVEVDGNRYQVDLTADNMKHL